MFDVPFDVTFDVPFDDSFDVPFDDFCWFFLLQSLQLFLIVLDRSWSFVIVLVFLPRTAFCVQAEDVAEADASLLEVINSIIEFLTVPMYHSKRFKSMGTQEPSADILLTPGPWRTCCDKCAASAWDSVYVPPAKIRIHTMMAKAPGVSCNDVEKKMKRRNCSSLSWFMLVYTAEFWGWNSFTTEWEMRRWVCLLQVWQSATSKTSGRTWGPEMSCFNLVVGAKPPNRTGGCDCAGCGLQQCRSFTS